MITNSAIIKFTLSNAIQSASITRYGDYIHNNISSNISSVINTKSTPSNPFLLGVSKLNEEATYVNDSLPYLIGDISNNNGKFTYSYTIKINGTFNNLTFSFDTLRDGYPNAIRVNGEVIEIRSSTVNLLLDYSLSSHILEIDNWSIPNSPFVIEGIYTDTDYEIRSNNLVSLNVKNYDRGDFNLPSWGIYSNTGSIKFKDAFGQIKDYSKSNTIYDNAEINVYLNINRKKHLIGIYKADTWQYNDTNKEVTITLADGLGDWQNVQVDTIPLGTEVTLYDLYVQLKQNTPEKWRSLIFLADANTSIHLRNTKIKHPYVKKGSLWSQWQKFCEVGGLYIYKSNEKIYIYYNGGL